MAVYNKLYCGSCEQCLTGRHNLCDNEPGQLGFNMDGGDAEYVVVPARNLVPVPPAVDFATAAVAVQLTLAANGTCEQVGIGLTNVGAVPIKATQAEAALRGKRPVEATIKQVAQLAADAAQPEADLRGSVEYKKDLVRVLTGRALRKAIERAQRGG